MHGTGGMWTVVWSVTVSARGGASNVNTVLSKQPPSPLSSRTLPTIYLSLLYSYMKVVEFVLWWSYWTLWTMLQYDFAHWVHMAEQRAFLLQCLSITHPTSLLALRSSGLHTENWRAQNHKTRNLKFVNFQQLLKHILRIFPCWWGATSTFVG